MSTPVLSDSGFTQLLAFYCPLPTGVCPDRKAMTEGTLAWAQRFDLGQGDEHTTMKLALNAGVFSAHMYPHATGDLGQALSDYAAWAWIPNDICGSGQPAADVLLTLGAWESIMHFPDSAPEATEPEGSHPAGAALRDACVRLRELMTPVQWQRWLTVQQLWLYQMAREAAVLERGTVLSVNDYLVMRMGSAGAFAAAGYLDAVEGIELSERQWARRDVRTATEAALLVGAVDNDRYSYYREHNLPVKKHNLFQAVLGEHPGDSLEEAVTKAVAIRDRLMSLYLRLRERILQDAGEDLHRYMSGIDLIISGNINFGMKTARYLLPDSPYTVTWTDKPSDPTPDPLPYPALTGWWKQLRR
ncbi:terpene synthase family protein [Streptomyces sp. NPDC055287]